MNTAWTVSLAGSLGVILTLLPAAADAQGSPRKGDRSETARQVPNPLPDLMILRFINDIDMGLGAERDDSELLVRVNALLPLRLTSKLNLVVNTIVPVYSRAPVEAGEDRINGVGNTLQHLLLGPARAGRFLWAFGPALELPTATRNALGPEQFSIGPSLVLSYGSPSWVLSLNAWHLRSVAGARNAPNVERTHFNPAVTHVTPSGVGLGIGSEVVVDWSAPAGERTTLPLLVTLSQAAQVGNRNIDLNLAGRYYLESPTVGPVWGFRLALAFTFEINRSED